MRLVIPIAVLLLAGCDVDNDPQSEQVTVNYDRERIKQSAKDAARTAGDVASGAARVAGSTKDAIEREVGDVDVDVKVSREPSEKTADEQAAGE